MSNIEAHFGRLIPIVLDGITLEERAKEVCSRLGLEISEYSTSWVDCLEDDGYKHALIVGDVIYEIRDIELNATGFSEGVKNADGSIDYYVSFFNGGAGLNEVLESVVKKTN